jgi:hypothetical protein
MDGNQTFLYLDAPVCGSVAQSVKCRELSQLLDLQHLVGVVGWLDTAAVPLMLKQQHLPNPQILVLRFPEWELSSMCPLVPKSKESSVSSSGAVVLLGCHSEEAWTHR